MPEKTKEPKQYQVNVQLSASLRNALWDLSHQLKVSRGEVVRMALSQFAKEHAKPEVTK
jgi:ribosomal protein L10